MIEPAQQDPATAAGHFALKARRTPVYRRVDVLVCGGGPAGVAAAVAAARAGAETLLVERNVVLGGNGPVAFDIALDDIDTGIAGEIRDRLVSAGQAEPDAAGGGALVFDPEAFKYACLDLCREAGVALLLSSWVSDPILDGETVRGAMVENKSGRFAIRAGMVIDATGDAQVALRAGAACEEPAGHRLAINARIGGIDIERAMAGRAQWPALIAAAKRAGQLDAGQPDTIELYGLTPTANERGVAFLAGSRFDSRCGWNADDLSDSEIVARKRMRTMIAFLRSVPGFEDSFVVDVAGAVAIGGARRIVGARPLGRADVDAVLGSKADSGGELPAGGLEPAGVSGLLVAGRAAPLASDNGMPEIAAATIGEIAGRIAAARLSAARAHAAGAL